MQKNRKIHLPPPNPDNQFRGGSGHVKVAATSIWNGLDLRPFYLGPHWQNSQAISNIKRNSNPGSGRHAGWAWGQHLPCYMPNMLQYHPENPVYVSQKQQELLFASEAPRGHSGQIQLQNLSSNLRECRGQWSTRTMRGRKQLYPRKTEQTKAYWQFAHEHESQTTWRTTFNDGDRQDCCDISCRLEKTQRWRHI